MNSVLLGISLLLLGGSFLSQTAPTPEDDDDADAGGGDAAAETPEGITADISASLEDWWTTFSTSWPRFDKTTEILQEIDTVMDKNMDLYSIGKTVQGRDMWVIKLGSDLTQERPILTVPMKLVANMHGDETLGRALLLMFAVDILTKYHDGDVRAVNLLENTELHFLYSMNTDGFEAAPEGECSPDPDAIGRCNANLADLNRDFPDQFVTAGETFEKLLENRQPETQNVMKWIVDNYFVLSANLHALSLVASYPFDSVTIEKENDPAYEGVGVISYSPDHDVFFKLATLYATSHTFMSIENNCSKGEFEGGVTNGAQWYNVRGGMQDFNYVHANTFDITFELSCCKFPPKETLLAEWEANKDALWKYTEASHWGIMGIVSDSDGKPIDRAYIYVKDNEHRVYTTDRGEYWRLLVPGRYTVWAQAEGYEKSEEVDALVARGDKLQSRYDFTLKPEAPGGGGE